MKKETLLHLSAALTIAPILSYAIMWRALDDGSSFLNLHGIIQNADPSIFLVIAVLFTVVAMLVRRTNSAHTKPSPRTHEQSFDTQAYSATRKPDLGGIVSLSLCTLYLTVTLLITFCHGNQQIVTACFLVIAVLSCPLGWLSAASVATNVSVCNWITFQMLSIGNCFLVGYGSIAIAKAFRNQYYLSRASMPPIPKEAKQDVTPDT